MEAARSSMLGGAFSRSEFVGTRNAFPPCQGTCSFPGTAAPSVVRVVAVKEIKGTVVKTANDKTAAVDVQRIYAHPLYKKRIRSVKRYQAHDPENQCKVGDTVTLAKCAPVSKSKKFVVVKIEAARVAGAASRAAAAAKAAAADAAEDSGAGDDLGLELESESA